MRKILPYILLLAISLTACTHSKKNYRIGVSQCSNDIWRDKQNAELRMGAYFHENVELLFATADDSDERQVQQIDSLVKKGIDLLIVAPNQVATISPAIDRAYDKGIPVIVFERKTNSKKYTAYMGADNYEMGRIMGEYVATRLKGEGNVVEVMGLKGSSPAIERHNGFKTALDRYPDIHITATLQGDWTEPTAYEITKEWLAANQGQPVDLVFGMNDRSAMGARRAILEASHPATSGSRLPLFCGIDGLSGKDGGIQLVRDSLLDASYIYPTRGDQLISLAMDILEGKPYDKETSLMSAIVTRANANVLLMEGEEVMRQSEYVEKLHQMTTGYLKQLANQRIFILLTIFLIVLLLLLVVGMRLYHRQHVRLEQERSKLEREQLEFYTQVSHELRTPLTLVEGPLNQLAATPEMKQASKETAQLLGILRRNAAQLSLLVNKIFDAQVGRIGQNLSSEQIDKLTMSQEREQHDMMLNEPDEAEKDAKADSELPTVLVVDDNPDLRVYLRSILQTDYRILDAADGQQGMAVAKEEVPDLILSDVMMPVMNGLDFCKQLKADEVTSHIPVILVTARAMNQHQVEGYQSGADAYLTKPFVAEVLKARIANLLWQRHELRSMWEGKKVEKKKEVANDPFIRRFQAVVDERLTDSDLSVEDIASELALSRVQLYRKVKAVTGCTPVDLLRKSRLTKARQLLVESDLTVSEIAYRVGFTSPSYFTKCFKDEYGTVPGEARTQF